jgi:hypothetical protein
VRLRTEFAAALDELVGSKAVRLLRAPRQLDPPRSLFARPDAVQPVVVADEVAAPSPEHADAERPQEVEDVAAEASLVGQERAFLVDAAVGTATEMLDEAAEDVRAQRTEGAAAIDRDPVHRGVEPVGVVPDSSRAAAGRRVGAAPSALGEEGSPGERRRREPVQPESARRMQRLARRTPYRRVITDYPKRFEAAPHDPLRPKGHAQPRAAPRLEPPVRVDCRTST